MMKQQQNHLFQHELQPVEKNEALDEGSEQGLELVVSHQLLFVREGVSLVDLFDFRVAYLKTLVVKHLLTFFPSSFFVKLLPHLHRTRRRPQWLLRATTIVPYCFNLSHFLLCTYSEVDTIIIFLSHFY